LRIEGVDANIDQYDPNPSEGWPRWMMKQIEDSDFVLAICTDIYKNRFEGREKEGGLGANWEGAILTLDIYKGMFNNNKIIPIVFSSGDVEQIPTVLKSFTYYQVDAENVNDIGYTKLYAYLTDQKLIEKPALGNVKQIVMPNNYSHQLPEVEEKNQISDNYEKPTIGTIRNVNILKNKPFFNQTLTNIGYRRNPFFTGREEQLEAIHENIWADGSVALSQPIAVSGLGGIGKTQVAIEYAYRYFDEYKFILWVTADSADSIISDFVAVAKLLDLSVKDDSDQNVVISAVINWLKTNDSWLLILDNADDIKVVEQFLPTGLDGHILLTSRAQSFDTLGIISSIEIEKMLPKDATDFILKRTGKKDLNVLETRALEELIEELDYLPLALEQAGAYIYKIKSSFAAYLSSYRKRGLNLLEKSRIKDAQYPKSVATTWLLNFEQVKTISLASADVLYMSALLYCDNIPFNILEKGSAELGENISSEFLDNEDDPLIVNEILEPLQQFSLINLNYDDQTYDIHRLVQAVIRSKIGDDGQRLWAERTIKSVNLIFPDVEFPTWDLCDKLLPHALVCRNSIKKWNFEFKEAAQLLDLVGQYLVIRARYTECQDFFSHALEIVKISLIHDEALTGTILSDIGNIYVVQGKYSEAEPFFKEALEIREKLFEREHPDVASTLNDLAKLYRYQGLYSEAEPLFDESLEIRRKLLGPEHLDISAGLNELAGLYSDQGRYSEAEPLYDESLSMAKRLLGSEHPGVAACLNNLAGLYRYQGRYSEAEPLYDESLLMAKKLFGPEHPNVATTLNNLAIIYNDQGKLSESELLYNESLKIRKFVFGYEHPDVATSLNNLGALYLKQGRYSETESFFNEALELRIKLFGFVHPDVANSMNNLAMFYSKQNRYLEAEPFFKDTLDISIKIFGLENYHVTDRLYNLAMFYHDQRKYLQSRSVFVQLFDIMEKIGYEDNLDFIIYLQKYATVLRKMRRNREATKISNHIVKISKKMKKHPEN
jgi:tetratricopeptide (TPR) repeat protein